MAGRYLSGLVLALPIVISSATPNTLFERQKRSTNQQTAASQSKNYSRELSDIIDANSSSLINASPLQTPYGEFRFERDTYGDRPPPSNSSLIAVSSGGPGIFTNPYGFTYDVISLRSESRFIQIDVKRQSNKPENENYLKVVHIDIVKGNPYNPWYLLEDEDFDSAYDFGRKEVGQPIHGWGRPGLPKRLNNSLEVMEYQSKFEEAITHSLLAIQHVLSK